MNNGMSWGKIVERAGPLLLVILLISYFAGDGWSAIPSGLVAWGTLMLAYVTFLSIKKSIEQGTQFRAENERLRQEDRERELQRHAIEFIYNWASQISEFTFIWYPFDTKSQLLDLWGSAVKLRINSPEAVQYSLIFDNEFQNDVKKVAKDFAAFTHTLLASSEDPKTHRIPNGSRDSIIEIKDKANDSALNLVRSITALKIRLKI